MSPAQTAGRGGTPSGAAARCFHAPRQGAAPSRARRSRLRSGCRPRRRRRWRCQRPAWQIRAVSACFPARCRDPATDCCTRPAGVRERRRCAAAARPPPPGPPRSRPMPASAPRDASCSCRGRTRRASSLRQSPAARPTGRPRNPEAARTPPSQSVAPWTMPPRPSRPFAGRPRRTPPSFQGRPRAAAAPATIGPSRRSERSQRRGR